MAEQKFRKLDRIREQGRFKEIFKKGRQIKTENFSAYFSKQESGSTNSRLGITQKKKIIRLSVQRHKISRLIRESFRKNKNRFQQTDIIIFPKNSKIIKINNHLIFSELEKIWYNIENQSH